MRALKICILVLLSLCTLAKEPVATSEFTINRLNVDKENVIIHFNESAPLYKGSRKILPCIQKGIKNKSKVEVKYNYKNFEIISCKNK